MTVGRTVVAGAALLLGCVSWASAQGGLTVPPQVQAGSAFSIQTSGSGKGSLYIVGPAQAIKQEVQLGSSVSIDAGVLTNAGHYIVYAGGASAPLDVVASSKPGDVVFLARPSRLPVGLRNGITGAVFVFDSFRNLILKPVPVSFQLSSQGSPTQSRTQTTKNGSAWVAMDSSAKEGAAHFVAQAGDVAETRVIGQVPGDPCGLRMSAKQNGNKLLVETDPVKDCSGNAVPDGTVVTFTETYNGQEATVDVPLKRGVAKVELPAKPGATITVASGVVLGNQVHWR